MILVGTPSLVWSLRILAFFSCTLSVANPAPTPEARLEKLTPEAVQNSASQHYPLIQAALRDVAKASAELLSAQGGFDPQVKLDATHTPYGYYQNTFLDATIEQPTPFLGTKFIARYRLGQGDFASYDGKLATFSGGEVYGGVELPLLRGNSIDERRGKLQTSERGLQMAQASLLSQRIEIERQATIKYWEWAAAGKKLEIARSMVKVAQDRDQALGSRVKQGDAPVFEKSDNERTILQRQSAEVASQRALQKAALELSLFYRSSDGNPQVPLPAQLPEALPEPSKEQTAELQKTTEDLMVTYVARNPELRRLDRQVSQTEVELKLSENLVLPKLNLKVGGTLDLGVANVPKFLVPTDYPGELKVSLNFEMPLLLRSPRGRQQSTQASLDRLQSILQLQRDRVRTAITDAQQAIEWSLKRVELAKKELLLAKSLEAGERTRFFHGDSNLLFVNIREQNTWEAALKQIDTLLEFQKAQADFKAAISELDESKS
ncbi:MAG: TolC family protein [Bdellovibrionia bacterium]